MPLSQLINRPCQIIRRSLEGEVDDGYGNLQSTEVIQEAVCELQQRQRDEPASTGQVSEEQWIAFFPAGTALDAGDGLLVDGERYEVLGDPWQTRNPRTKQWGQLEATLSRAAGSEDAS